MIQYATVKKLIDNDRAVITVIRESACGKSCASCGGCGAKAQIMDAVANNLCGAEVGARVCVEMSTRRVIGIASLIYILPLIAFFALCLGASALGASEGICILSGAAGIVLAFCLVRYINKTFSKKSSSDFNIISVVNGEL